MLTDEQFQELTDRIRAGDEDAAKECVRLYEQEIRRAARMRLTDPKLRRIMDSMDICQSVFGRFFRGALDGTLQLDQQEQVLGLLVAMTRNRVIDEHRRQTAQKRDGGQRVGGSEEILDLITDSPGPRTAAATRELFHRVRALLGPDELAIVDRRNAGESWDEIAADLGETPGAVRKRAERALARVRETLRSERQES